MPEVDGYAATAEIRRRELETGSHVPIVALTANALEGDREVCIAAGMDDYLAKPFSGEQLRSTLARWLSPSHQEPAVAAPDTPPTPPARIVSACAVEEEPVNPRALDALRALVGPGGNALVRKVVLTYLEDMPAGLQRMQEAAKAGSAEALRKIAHSMKSSSSNVGAERMSRLCKDLETIGRTGSVEGALPLLDDAAGELVRVVSALEAQLAPGSSIATS